MALIFLHIANIMYDAILVFVNRRVYEMSRTFLFVLFTRAGQNFKARPAGHHAGTTRNGRISVRNVLGRFTITPAVAARALSYLEHAKSLRIE